MSLVYELELKGLVSTHYSTWMLGLVLFNPLRTYVYSQLLGVS
ncbi:unnamed protein product [Staurois parvus]|uniref:Uncharacterized protein n=1 Tax=Staurois parvus TaxID=386267 RepID=A0ABN9DU13_9NEOB|nr:unnamed protein product [Staurois parvus]